LQSANNRHLNPAFASPSLQCDVPHLNYKRFKEQSNRTHRFGRLGAGYLAGGPSGAKSDGRFGKQDFVYLPTEDVYRCPAGEKLACL
jgi:hypothetical protein